VSRSSRVCVEIGAGAGEWLVAQAAAHRSTAWVAIEPQLDRVHQLWCKVQLQRLEANVHICAADAAAALKLLPAATADAVYLRYPYPPPLELRDLTAPSPPRGIFLAASLLTDALRVLRPGGELHFVTNEPACCALLLALVHAHPAGAQLRSEHGEAGFARSLEAPGPHGSSSGSGSSSFFDAVLAERGHRKDHSEVRHERFSLTYTFHPPPEERTLTRTI
jgi:SAM-dependent methyltransferase